VADSDNAHAIITELSEYVGDIDEQLAREAVRAVGRIALDVRAPGRCVAAAGLHAPACTMDKLGWLRDLSCVAPNSCAQAYQYRREKARKTHSHKLK